MTVAAPTLYWYQLDVETYIPTYFTQLDTSVRALCAANSVTAPPTLLSALASGGYVSAWLSGTDKGVRSLCTVLSVTPPIALNQTAGQFESTYLQSLDTAVRALCNAGGAYTGPLDIVGGAVVAYGQRALSSAKRGSALYTIRRDSDNTTQSFNSDATTGDAPSAAISAFIGGGNGFSTLWNDQSGNSNNVAQAIAANQPQWTANVVNDHPSIIFDGLATFLETASDASFANGQYSAFAILNCTDLNKTFLSGIDYSLEIGAFFAFECQGNPGAAYAPYCDAADGLGNEAGTVFADSAVSSGYVLIDAQWQVGQRVGAVNGSAVAPIGLPFDSGTTVGTISGIFCVGTDDAGATSGRIFAGAVAELIIYPAIVSGSNLASLRQNIAAYYGITLA